MDETLMVSFRPEALERCFLAAQRLDELRGIPTEYAMIGLAAASDPLHVVATPLLCNQRGTPTTVWQSGRDVLRMHHEIERLSARAEMTLVPTVFIHRHPGSCHMSDTDDDFLSTTFIDQVSTALTFRRTDPMGRAPEWLRSRSRPCERRPGCEHLRNGQNEPEALAVCAGLIVNKFRAYCVYALCKEFCAICPATRVQYVPAGLAVRPTRVLSAAERADLREELARELESKVRRPEAACGPER
jgi:hypothetical protein